MSGAAESEEMQIKSVYHSVESIMRVLKSDQYSALEEVQILLDKYYVCYPENEENLSQSVSRRKHFIVFEGLDGSGKSTVGWEVAKKLYGFKIVTPPKSLSALRKQFDQQPPVLRRAFYSLGNYISAKEIQDICKKKHVVLDRYWHSTTAYALAQEFNGQDEDALPPMGHPIYKWPKDLLKPDIVLFLDVDEETRRKRHERRKHTTKEEDELARDQDFRSLVLAAFNRIDDIPIVHVDSSLSIEETVAECLKQIKLLPKLTKPINEVC